MEASTVGTGNDQALVEAGVEIPDAETATAAEPDVVATPPAKPDITKAQLVGVVPIVANLLTAFHVFTVTAQQQHALELAIGGSIGLFLADAVIRFGRSKHL